VTALAARSGLLDSEFIYAADSTASGIMSVATSSVATGGPRRSVSDDSESPVPWVLVWAASSLGGYLLAYSVAVALLP